MEAIVSHPRVAFGAGFAHAVLVVSAAAVAASVSEETGARVWVRHGAVQSDAVAAAAAAVEAVAADVAAADVEAVAAAVAAAGARQSVVAVVAASLT